MDDFTDSTGQSNDYSFSSHSDLEAFEALISQEYQTDQPRKSHSIANLDLMIADTISEYTSAHNPAELDPYLATELVGQVEASVARLKAIQALAVVSAVGPVAVTATHVRKTSDVTIEDVRSSELGAYLNISPLSARNLAEYCRDLIRFLPKTYTLLSAGQIDEAKAKIVVEGAHKIYINMCQSDPDIKDVNDSRVLAMMQRYEASATLTIARRSRSQVRQAVNKAVARLTPVAIDTRFKSEREERFVEFIDQGTGMTLMQALMTNLDAAKVQNALEFTAKNDSTLKGSMRNRMSDALVSIMMGESEISPERRYAASRVEVMVSAETLLGISDEPATILGSDFVLTASAVRELAEHSQLRRVIIDSETGALLDLGRKVYVPTPQIKDFVKMRDRQCRAPGCVRNAIRCDVDHVEAWDDGGETKADNLVALCRRHHVLKTIGTWKYELKPNGDAVWTLPDGHEVIDYFERIDNPANNTDPANNIYPDNTKLNNKSVNNGQNYKPVNSRRVENSAPESVQREEAPCPF